MTSITQDMKYRLSLIRYAEKYGVTKAAIKYKTNRQYIYRWKRRFDGSIESLRDRSRRPHSHPNQHTSQEIQLIRNMRRRNPHTGLVTFWVKLRQRGYTTIHYRIIPLSKKAGYDWPKSFLTPNMWPSPMSRCSIQDSASRLTLNLFPQSVWSVMPKVKNSISTLRSTSIPAGVMWRPLKNTAPIPLLFLSNTLSDIFQCL